MTMVSTGRMCPKCGAPYPGSAKPGTVTKCLNRHSVRLPKTMAMESYESAAGVELTSIGPVWRFDCSCGVWLTGFAGEEFARAASRLHLADCWRTLPALPPRPKTCPDCGMELRDARGLPCVVGDVVRGHWFDSDADLVAINA